MSRKKIIVLGAGLAGLSAAWHLKRKGIECQVFEKESQPGGLCRSKKVGGFTFDFSGHLLHFKSDYAFRLIKGLLGSNLAEHKRSAWVYSHRAYNRYPFQANLHGLPAPIAKECLLGFIRASGNKHSLNNGKRDFLSWIYQTFGSGIARHFMVPYNTKFWTVSPGELTCEWLDGFIPVPSLNEVVGGLIKQSRKQFGYNSRFWYPKKGGIGELPRAMAADLKGINLNREAVSIDLKKKHIVFSDGRKEGFDCLVSTLPLPELGRLLVDIPKDIASNFRKLRWNSIFNLNLGLSEPLRHSRHWVYFPQPDLSFFRVGFFSNFSSHMAPLGSGSLYAEVSCLEDKPLNRAVISSKIEHDLKKIGILGENTAINIRDCVDIKYGYPIYDTNYNQARAGILEYLGSHNILSRGRYGSWRYMSMEDVMLDGEKTARLLRDV